jgi:hypothetical protein
VLHSSVSGDQNSPVLATGREQCVESELSGWICIREYGLRQSVLAQALDCSQDPQKLLCRFILEYALHQQPSPVTQRQISEV